MAVAGFGQGLVLSPLFGAVLAGVPAERAGVGGGVLTTTQQTALALGVATIGSLFLSLSSASELGVRDAFVVVLALQSVIALVVAYGATTLPQRSAASLPLGPRAQPEPALEAA
jgi:hypothetical protein